MEEKLDKEREGKSLKWKCNLKWKESGREGEDKGKDSRFLSMSPQALALPWPPPPHPGLAGEVWSLEQPDRRTCHFGLDENLSWAAGPFSQWRQGSIGTRAPSALPQQPVPRPTRL